MSVAATRLEDLPYPVVDIDVDEHGSWVAVCRQRGGLIVHSMSAAFPVPQDIRFPMIRWLPGGRVLLVDARVESRRNNAYVVSAKGENLTSFCIGDGVADIVIIGDRIVATYFDEGVLSGVGPSREGVCAFREDSSIDVGYVMGVPGAVDFVDCYCVCAAGRHEVVFLPYPDFPLVRLHLGKRVQTAIEIPEMLHGASAITTDGRAFVLHAPYVDTKALFRWEPGLSPERIGEWNGRLRAHGRMSLLAAESSGFSVLTFD